MVKKIFVSGGGTGGHIVPALKMAEKFRKTGFRVIYLGNKNSMEEKLCIREHHEFKHIKIDKFYRKELYKNFFSPLYLVYSIIVSLKYFLKCRPLFFLGTGGYVSGPVAVAALLMRVPVFLHEQNSLPGVTTKFLQPFARRVFTGMKLIKPFKDNSNVFFTGNPINCDQPGRDKKNKPNNTVGILVLGGSQGSWFLNEIAKNLVLNKNIIKELLFLSGKKKYQLYWQTGERHFDEVFKEFGDDENIELFDYSDNISKFYAAADLCITRGSAMVLSELETCRLPMIIVPLPSSAENHQMFNALTFKRKGIAEIVEQNEKSFGLVVSALKKMISNYDKYLSSFTESVHSDAVEKIYNEIMRGLEIEVDNAWES